MSTAIEELVGREQSTATTPNAPSKANDVPWIPFLAASGISLLVVLLMMSPTIFSRFFHRNPAAGGNQAAAVAVAPTVDPVAKLRGQNLFSQGCNACHGDDARGRPGLGKDLVHSAFVKSQDDTQLIGFIKRGRDIGDPLNTTKVPMPPKGGNPALNDTQLKDIVAYVRGIQGQ
jgi:disulfide bond formation protein DsbB